MARFTPQATADASPDTTWVSGLRAVFRDSGQTLFFIALGLELVLGILNTSFFGLLIPGEANDVVHWIACGCLILAELLCGRYRTSTVVGLGIVALMMICFSVGGSMQMIEWLWMIYVGRNFSFRRIAFFALWVTGISVAFVIVCAYAGVITNYVAEDRNRMYLGFYYALFPAQYGFLITGLVAYWRGRRFFWVETVLLTLMNLYFYITTDSRLSFLLAMCIVVGALILHWTGDWFLRSQVFGTIVCCAFIIFAIVIIALSAAYSPNVELLAKVNSVLGDRLALGFGGIHDYGIPVFGQPLALWGNGLSGEGFIIRLRDYNYIDSLYVKFLVQYGWVGITIFLGVFTAVMFQAWKQKNIVLVMVLFFLAAHCMIDDLSMNVFYDTFLMLAGSLMTASSLSSFKPTPYPRRLLERREARLRQAEARKQAKAIAETAGRVGLANVAVPGMDAAEADDEMNEDADGSANPPSQTPR